MSETLDERIVRLKRELAEARAEKRCAELSKLLNAPGVVVKPRAKPGPKPKYRRRFIANLGVVKPISGRRWQFEVEFGEDLICGPPRDSALVAAEDRDKWRRNEIEKERAARSPGAWSEPDDGRQTCLDCKGEGTNAHGVDCGNCAGEGYRWV